MKKDSKKVIEKDKEVIVYSNKNLIKCHKCGEYNIKSVHKCIGCGEKLAGSKSCPRCAKINNGDVKKCESCGFNFDTKKKGVLASFIFSFIILIVLLVLKIANKENIVLNFTNSFRIIAIILVCLIVISTFTYGKKEKIDYNLMFDASTKSFRKKQIIGTIIIGALVAGVCFLIYYFVFMNK